MKQLENHSVLRGNLKQLYGVSPLSLEKINNFRRLFRLNANYDEIEQVALSFGDYAIRNGDARNYAGNKPNDWRDRIFVNSNVSSLPTFEAMLSRASMTYQDYVDHKNQFLAYAHSNRAFDWPYYLCNYQSMRWAPRGWYLLAGVRYLYYMFKASTCIHSDTYIHYNVYNDVLFGLLGSDKTAEDNRGGALTVLSTGATVDVTERTINIELADGSRYHVEIPENHGIDSVDRVQLAEKIVERLVLTASLSEEDGTVLKTIVESDLDAQDWPDLIKDSAAETDETALSAQNDITREL